MEILLKLLIAVIAFEHLFIAYVELFAWETKGPSMFSTIDKEFASKTKQMAQNQGLYNLFLVAGMIWAILSANPAFFALALFFLLCVVIAGTFGAFTVEKTIFFKQALPALIVVILLVISHLF